MRFDPARRFKGLETIRHWLTPRHIRSGRYKYSGCIDANREFQIFSYRRAVVSIFMGEMDVSA